MPEIKVTDITFDEKYEITDHTILGEVSESLIQMMIIHQISILISYNDALFNRALNNF